MQRHNTAHEKLATSDTFHMPFYGNRSYKMIRSRLKSQDRLISFPFSITAISLPDLIGLEALQPSSIPINNSTSIPMAQITCLCVKLPLMQRRVYIYISIFKRLVLLSRQRFFPGGQFLQVSATLPTAWCQSMSPAVQICHLMKMYRASKREREIEQQQHPWTFEQLKFCFKIRQNYEP